MDEIVRKVNLRNLYFKCLAETGSIDDFFNKLIEDEKELISDAQYEIEDEMRNEIKRQVLNDLKEKIGDFIKEA